MLERTHGRACLAQVQDIHTHPNRAVIEELQRLLGLALAGKLVGLSYAYITRDRQVLGGLAGIYVLDRWRATGVLAGCARSVGMNPDS